MKSKYLGNRTKKKFGTIIRLAKVPWRETNDSTNSGGLIEKPNEIEIEELNDLFEEMEFILTLKNRLLYVKIANPTWRKVFHLFERQIRFWPNSQPPNDAKVARKRTFAIEIKYK